MRVSLNGEDQGYTISVKPADTIAILKQRLRAPRHRYTVTMTFANGETLLPVVWESNEYDRVTLEHYRDVIEGGTIELTTKNQPTINQPQVINEPPINQQRRIRNQPRNQPAAMDQVARNVIITELHNFISRNISEEDYIGIGTQLTDFTETFRTYEEFLQEQNRMLTETTDTRLKYLKDTMREIRPGNILLVELDEEKTATVGLDPDVFFLMPGNRIVLLGKA